MVSARTPNSQKMRNGVVASSSSRRSKIGARIFTGEKRSHQGVSSVSMDQPAVARPFAGEEKMGAGVWLWIGGGVYLKEGERGREQVLKEEGKEEENKG